MKNKLKNTSKLSLILFIFAIFNLTKAYGISISESSNKQDLKWITMDEKREVSKDKIWNIKFNKAIHKEEGIEKNIYVLDENNNLVSTLISLVAKDREINVAPKEKYVSGKKYNLCIKGLKSKDGSLLKNNVKMPFNIVDENTIKVKNAKELLDNIGPNRTLILKSGDYNLLEPQVINNKHIKYEEVFDGKEIILKDLDNLTIKGEEGAKVQLLVQPRYANVLTFNKCNNIKIENVIAGHYPDEGYCTGGVLYFDSCNGIGIKNADLFGCGTMGIILDNVENLAFDNSIIRDCSYGIMDINQSKNVKFNKSSFHDCREFDLIEVKSSKDIEFNECDICNNITENYEEDWGYYLFKVDPNSKVVVNKGSIKGNVVKGLINDEQRVIFNDVHIEDK